MSAFDYSISFTLYVGTITSWEKMLYNLAHNLGNIYDLVEEAIKRTIDWQHNYLKISYWARMGYIIGRVFQMVFEEPKNYYEDKTVGKWTVIGKEDKEREDFGSGGGNVVWRKGDEVGKEADSLAQQDGKAGTPAAPTGPAADSGGWGNGGDASWDAERTAWEGS